MTCPICLDENGLERRIVLDCGHGIHETCFLHLINNKHTQCPLCRKNFSLEITYMFTTTTIQYTLWICFVVATRIIAILCICTPILILILLTPVMYIQIYFIVLILMFSVRMLCTPIPPYRMINHIIQ